MWLWNKYREMIVYNCLEVNNNLNGLAYWRNRLFCNIMLFFAPFSVFSVVPGIIMSFKTHIPMLGYIDAAALFFAFFISFNRALSIKARKILFIGLLYIMAIILIYYLGSFGPGLLYLLVISIFCILIFSNYMAYISVGINALICALFGLAIYLKWIDGAIFHQYTVGAWSAISINLIVVTAIMAILLPVIFNGMQQSNDRYELVAKATSDTVCDWDLEKDTKTYSTGIYKVFGYSYDEVKDNGQWWLDNIHPDDLQKVKGIIDKTVKSGGLHFQTEYRFKCADGNYKHILYRSYILRNEYKKAVRIISSMQDVTDRINYIKAIVSQNKKLKEISWQQSHVVRAPLTRIMGLVGLLINLPPESINTSDVVSYIEISANELDSVIREIIKQAEIDMGLGLNGN